MKSHQEKNSIRIDQELGSIMKRIWMDPGTQKAVERSREFQLNDSAI